MRLHERILVTAAVVFATTAVAANVFAQTRANDERARLATTTMTFAPIPDGSDAGLAPSSGRDADLDASLIAEPTEDEAAGPGAPPWKEQSNHGLTVRAYILGELNFVEGVDGPPGAVIREIARPDVEEDGPPRSDQAEANLDAKVKKDPPGRSGDH
jgi:hypothetical protein